MNKIKYQQNKNKNYEEETKRNSGTENFPVGVHYQASQGRRKNQWT